MKSRMVLSAIATSGILALAATAAQAGGAAGAASFNTFFQCQVIDGATVGEVVSTHLPDEADTLVRSGVTVGRAVLWCRQVNVKNAAGAFVNGDISSTEVKCYTATVKGPRPAASELVFQDDFLSSDTAAVSERLDLLCGPTIATTPPPQ